jgi:hypothetical protein
MCRNILDRSMAIGVAERQQPLSVSSATKQSATAGCATPAEEPWSTLFELSNTSPNALGARERAKLEGILARLTSPYESERATAALFANAFLAKYGLTWSHLVSLLEPMLETAGASAGTLGDGHHGSSDRAGGYRARRAGSPGQALDVVA